eukprot:gene28198-34050_t
MKRIAQLLITLGTFFLMTACGGGGSSDSYTANISVGSTSHVCKSEVAANLCKAGDCSQCQCLSGCPAAPGEAITLSCLFYNDIARVPSTGCTLATTPAYWGTNHPIAWHSPKPVLKATASLQALGHVRLEAVMSDRVHAATSTGWNRTWWGKTTTWTTYHDRAWRNVNPVSVNARNIEIKAGNNVETYASRLNASNNLKIEAGDQALYYAVKNETDHNDTTFKKSSWIGIRLNKSTEHNTTRISTPMVTNLYARNGNLTSWSGGDQLYQGTIANYYSRDIQAGVGEKARADARIILEGVKTSVFHQRTKESNYVVWQKQINQGSHTETLTLPSFTGTVNTPFKAPGGITVQIPEGDFRSQIATLSAQPGMAYLNELAARSDVNWQPVKLAHDKWDYKQEGLTPAGAALLSVAVAWATGGMGANLLGTTGATTSALTNAAFASLAAQASIRLINGY